MDAEEEGTDERHLKDASDRLHRKERLRNCIYRKDSKSVELTELVMDTSSRYYQMLSENLHTEKHFDDEFDRVIMEMTADAKSIKEISAVLKKMVPEGKQRGKFNRRTIRYVRRRYEKKWGVREWKPEQMTSSKPRTK